MAERKPYSAIHTGAIKRAYSAARTDHRAEPETTPAPRTLPYYLQMGVWAERERSHHDNHKRRDHQRRQQRQRRQQERAALLARQDMY